MSISDSTLKRAKRKLKVVSDEIRDGKTISGWTWRLPTYTSDPLELLDHVDPLDLKQAHGAVLWAKSVVFGVIGSGQARLSLVGERFGAGVTCVEFTGVDGAGFLGG